MTFSARMRARWFVEREAGRALALLHRQAQRVDKALLRLLSRFSTRNLMGMSLGPTEHKYVAFLDILGFSARIAEDFEAAKELYGYFAGNMGFAEGFEQHPRLTIRVVSDSIVVVSDAFGPMVSAVRTLISMALHANCLVRGGIAYGKHSEYSDLLHTYVVSEPLVHAVKREKDVRRPCVAFHSSVTIPDDAWKFNCDSFLRPILYYDGLWIVNPFNIGWGTSAAGRVEDMKDNHPQHAEKYNWFLGLYERVRDRGILWPEETAIEG